jgi:hypothetical protein
LDAIKSSNKLAELKQQREHFMSDVIEQKEKKRSAKKWMDTLKDARSTM